MAPGKRGGRGVLKKSLWLGAVGIIVLIIALAWNYAINMDEADTRATAPIADAPVPPAAEQLKAPAPEVPAVAVAPPPRQESPPPEPEPVRAPTPPSFDVVRVEPNGDAVIAGRAEPTMAVTVLDGGSDIGTETADVRGEWVLVPSRPLPPGSRELSLIGRMPDGTVVESEQVVVLVVSEPETDVAGRPSEEAAEALALVVPRTEEGEIAVLQAPPATTEPEPTEMPETPKPEPSPPVAVPAEPPPATPESASQVATPVQPAPPSEPPATPAPAPQETVSPPPVAAPVPPPPPQIAIAPAPASEPPSPPKPVPEVAAPTPQPPPKPAPQIAAAPAPAPEPPPPPKPAPQTAVAPAPAPEPPAPKPAPQIAVAPAPAPEPPLPKPVPQVAVPTPPPAPKPPQPAPQVAAKVAPPPVPAEPPPPPRELALQIVDYDELGRVFLIGRAEPDANLFIYLSNRLIGTAAVDAKQTWRLRPEAPVAPGQYRLRVDDVGEAGKVLARIEVPFVRSVVTGPLLRNQYAIVQPGNSLWRIARRTYGSGLKFTIIYQANKNYIQDPDLIYPGQVFKLPSAG